MWDDIKSLIGDAAPLIGTLIGGPVGTAVGGLVSNALGVANTPEAITQALQESPDAVLQLKQLESAHERDLKQLALEHAKLESEIQKLAITQQNATIQAELASNDVYVRRWRPTWGYSMCLAWVSLFIGIAFVMIVHPEHAAAIVNSIVAMTPLFGIGLTVLGLNIHKRSQDKQIANGIQPMGTLNAIRSTVTGKGHQ